MEELGLDPEILGSPLAPRNGSVPPPHFELLLTGKFDDHDGSELLIRDKFSWKLRGRAGPGKIVVGTVDGRVKIERESILGP